MTAEDTKRGFYCWPSLPFQYKVLPFLFGVLIGILLTLGYTYLFAAG